MFISRRQLLKIITLSSIVASFASMRSTFAQTISQPQRISLTSFSENPNLVETFRRGVRIMKSRPPSDPKSWFYQGAVHSLSEAFYEQAHNEDSQVEQVLQDGRFWIQCPHNGPFYDFALWHRAYLWHFERILADAAGDPDLRIPYWNYDNLTERTFPRIFAEALPQTGDPDGSLISFERNSLYDARRDHGLMNGLYVLSERAAGTDNYADQKTFFGTATQPMFGGSANVPGSLEIRPHGTIHTAIGGSIESTSGLMSCVPTAAFDPIFWVHHCNIERLLREWECQPQVTWGEMPTGWLEERPWHFQDADGTIHNHPRSFYLDNSNLNAHFDTDNPSCVPLSERTPILVASSRDALPQLSKDSPLDNAEANAAVEAFSLMGLRLEASRSSKPAILSAEQHVSLTLSVDTTRGLKDFSPMRVQNMHLLMSLVNKTILVLDDITFKEAPSVQYDVHLNPNGAPNDESFIGSIDTFHLSMTPAPSVVSDDHLHHSIRTHTRIEFDISDREDLKTTEMQVVIVPVSLYEALDGNEVPSRSGGIEVGSIILERAP